MNDTNEIDWRTELRKIEREYDGLPPELPAASLRAQKEAEARAREQERAAVFGASARLMLVGALAGALVWWPYGTACGPDLVAYVVAQAMIVIGGLWVAVYTWRHRLAASHSIALVLVLAGLMLLAAQVLPRMGYASIAGVERTRWLCTSSEARHALPNVMP